MTLCLAAHAMQSVVFATCRSAVRTKGVVKGALGYEGCIFLAKRYGCTFCLHAANLSVYTPPMCCDLLYNTVSIMPATHMSVHLHNFARKSCAAAH
jgi:hypothetical protein